MSHHRCSRNTCCGRVATKPVGSVPGWLVLVVLAVASSPAFGAGEPETGFRVGDRVLVTFGPKMGTAGETKPDLAFFTTVRIPTHLAKPLGQKQRAYGRWMLRDDGMIQRLPAP